MQTYGGDRFEVGEGTSVRLTSTGSKGWRGRSTPTASRQAPHPGTAVSWEGTLYEVMDVKPLPSGDTRYSLAPWDDAQAIRVLEQYDAPSERARERERIGRADAVKRRRAAILLSPLLGHLPGEVQERMESEFGAPANKMTVASAVPLLVLGIFGLFAVFARAMGGSPEPLPEPPLLVSLYLTLESYLRLSVVATQSRPAGSVPGAVLYAAWSALARKRGSADGDGAKA